MPRAITRPRPLPLALRPPQIYDQETDYFHAEYTNFGTVLKARAGCRRQRRAGRAGGRAEPPSLQRSTHTPSRSIRNPTRSLSCPCTRTQGFEGFLTSKNASAKNKVRLPFETEQRAFSLSSITSPAVSDKLTQCQWWTGGGC